MSSQYKASSDFEISPSASIGYNCVILGRGSISDDVVIGHNVVIEGNVSIGAGTRIGHHVTITGDVVIGERNCIHSFCSIGDLPQHPDMRHPSGGVLIGNDNVLREYVTVHAPTVEAMTVIQDGCYIMAYCHIAHDVVVGSNVKMANNATLAGHVIVGPNSYLGLHSVVHQRLEIGEFCMIGMNTEVMKNVPPFCVLFKHQIKKVNRIGLSRTGHLKDKIDELEAHVRGDTISSGRNPLVDRYDEFYLRFGEKPIYEFSDETRRSG